MPPHATLWACCLVFWCALILSIVLFRGLGPPTHHSPARTHNVLTWTAFWMLIPITIAFTADPADPAAVPAAVPAAGPAATAFSLSSAHPDPLVGSVHLALMTASLLHWTYFDRRSWFRIVDMTLCGVLITVINYRGAQSSHPSSFAGCASITVVIFMFFFRSVAQYGTWWGLFNHAAMRLAGEAGAIYMLTSGRGAVSRYWELPLVPGATGSNGLDNRCEGLDWALTLGVEGFLTCLQPAVCCLMTLTPICIASIALIYTSADWPHRIPPALGCSGGDLVTRSKPTR